MRHREEAGTMHAIETDAALGLVAATLHGDVHFDERHHMIDEVVDAAKTAGALKILIDLSLARIAADGLEAAYRFANRLSHDEYLATCRIAYVGRPAQHDPAVEILAAGKGYEAERFTSRDAAIVWLRDG
jgi:hypothetical protein